MCGIAGVFEYAGRTAADPVRRALDLVRQYDVSQLPVLDGERVVGTVYDAKIMKLVLDDPTALDRPVRDIMESPLPIVGKDEPVTCIECGATFVLALPPVEAPIGMPA